MIPRERYPRTTTGYHQWRDAPAQFHAEEAEKTLRVLQRTIFKMTPEAREQVLRLRLGKPERDLVPRAIF